MSPWFQDNQPLLSVSNFCSVRDFMQLASGKVIVHYNMGSKTQLWMGLKGFSSLYITSKWLLMCLKCVWAHVIRFRGSHDLQKTDILFFLFFFLSYTYCIFVCVKYNTRVCMYSETRKRAVSPFIHSGSYFNTLPLAITVCH